MTRLSQKDMRIIKLHDKGMTDISKLAQKIGYGGKNLSAGIERVREALMKAETLKKHGE